MKIESVMTPTVVTPKQAKEELKDAAKEEKKLTKAEGYAILSQQDQLNISYLKGETDKSFQSLRDIVKDLLKRQGIELKDLDKGKTVKVDAEAQAEAAKMIGPDGPLGPEKTAERIFQFAKSISGGDKGKLDQLREAIENGYKEAEKAFGGKLPDISKQTMELVRSKLDAWEKETAPVQG